ncbi:hypothetical protein B5S28_g2127 [[Candida] boidinii]|nr:hypothetical protein B5S28_g2127 [[Candida] boidinii]OWB63105.1 hypothetical protein B5S29_g4061 [[Candida] boidinii]
MNPNFKREDTIDNIRIKTSEINLELNEKDKTIEIPEPRERFLDQVELPYEHRASTVSTATETTTNTNTSSFSSFSLCSSYSGSTQNSITNINNYTNSHTSNDKNTNKTSHQDKNNSSLSVNETKPIKKSSLNSNNNNNNSNNNNNNNNHHHHHHHFHPVQSIKRTTSSIIDSIEHHHHIHLHHHHSEKDKDTTKSDTYSNNSTDNESILTKKSSIKSNNTIEMPKPANNDQASIHRNASQKNLQQQMSPSSSSSQQQQQHHSSFITKNPIFRIARKATQVAGEVAFGNSFIRDDSEDRNRFVQLQLQKRRELQKKKSEESNISKTSFEQFMEAFKLYENAIENFDSNDTLNFANSRKDLWVEWYRKYLITLSTKIEEIEQIVNSPLNNPIQQQDELRRASTRTNSTFFNPSTTSDILSNLNDPASRRLTSLNPANSRIPARSQQQQQQQQQQQPQFQEALPMGHSSSISANYPSHHNTNTSMKRAASVSASIFSNSSSSDSSQSTAVAPSSSIGATSNTSGKDLKLTILQDTQRILVSLWCIQIFKKLLSSESQLLPKTKSAIKAVRESEGTDPTAKEDPPEILILINQYFSNEYDSTGFANFDCVTGWQMVHDEPECHVNVVNIGQKLVTIYDPYKKGYLNDPQLKDKNPQFFNPVLPDNVQNATQHQRTFFSKYSSFATDSYLHIPMKTNSQSVVYCPDLSYIAKKSDILESLKEIHRVLKPFGAAQFQILDVSVLNGLVDNANLETISKDPHELLAHKIWYELGKQTEEKGYISNLISKIVPLLYEAGFRKVSYSLVAYPQVSTIMELSTDDFAYNDNIQPSSNDSSSGAANPKGSSIPNQNYSFNTGNNASAHNPSVSTNNSRMSTFTTDYINAGSYSSTPYGGPSTPGAGNNNNNYSGIAPNTPTSNNIPLPEPMSTSITPPPHTLADPLTSAYGASPGASSNQTTPRQIKAKTSVDPLESNDRRAFGLRSSVTSQQSELYNNNSYSKDVPYGGYKDGRINSFFELFASNIEYKMMCKFGGFDIDQMIEESNGNVQYLSRKLEFLKAFINYKLKGDSAVDSLQQLNSYAIGTQPAFTSSMSELNSSQNNSSQIYSAQPLSPTSSMPPQVQSAAGHQGIPPTQQGKVFKQNYNINRVISNSSSSIHGLNNDIGSMSNVSLNAASNVRNEGVAYFLMVIAEK